MAKDNSVREKYTTGKGELTGYVGLFKPSTQYDSYSANILLSREEGVELLKKLEDIRKQQFRLFGKGSSLKEITQCKPFAHIDEETLETTPDPQGRYILKASAKGYSKDGVPDYVIRVFDSKQKPVKEVSVGAGTTAKLAVELQGYTRGGVTGVSVRLRAVQIIDLVEYENNTAASYNFDEEEGSFEASDETMPWEEPDNAEENF